MKSAIVCLDQLIFVLVMFGVLLFVGVTCLLLFLKIAAFAWG